MRVTLTHHEAARFAQRALQQTFDETITVDIDMPEAKTEPYKATYSDIESFLKIVDYLKTGGQLPSCKIACIKQLKILLPNTSLAEAKHAIEHTLDAAMSWYSGHNNSFSGIPSAY